MGPPNAASTVDSPGGSCLEASAYQLHSYRLFLRRGQCVGVALQLVASGQAATGAALALVCWQVHSGPDTSGALYSWRLTARRWIKMGQAEEAGTEEVARLTRGFG